MGIPGPGPVGPSRLMPCEEADKRDEALRGGAEGFKGGSGTCRVRKEGDGRSVVQALASVE
jgi:hypothetical protein